MIPPLKRNKLANTTLDFCQAIQDFGKFDVLAFRGSNAGWENWLNLRTSNSSAVRHLISLLSFSD